MVELERLFEITEEDSLNIKLAETVGVTHLAVSYPQVKHLVGGKHFQFSFYINEVINSINGGEANKNILRRSGLILSVDNTK